MTKRYTVADFANAKFAEHEDGRTAMKPSGHTRWDVKLLDGRRSVRGNCHMASFGWVPVPTKPQITESAVNRIAFSVFNLRPNLATIMSWLNQELTDAGIEITPGPTNTDRLAKLLGEVATDAGVNLNPRLFAEQLDNAGVTVNKENN